MTVRLFVVTLLVLVSHDEGDAAALAEERWLLVDGQLTRL